MSEIDVSKCEFLIINNDKYLCRCIKSDLFGGIEFVENAKSGTCKDNPKCYYKQLQGEINATQKWYQEHTNEKFRAEKYKQCLDDIEEIIKEFAEHNILTFPDLTPKSNYRLIQEQCSEPVLKIAQKIKEVKGSE